MRNNIITIHYGEIALKGKQRGRFESMLIRNVQEITGFRPMRMSSRLFLKEWNDDTRYLLSMIPGIEWMGDGLVIDRDNDVLREEVSRLASTTGEKRLNLDVRRVDKSFERTSLQLKEDLQKNIGFRYDASAKKVVVEIMKDSFIINSDIKRGVGGVPIGSAGRVLALFSGGIDSAVVPFEMMKRGCNVDLLHVYALPNRDAVTKGKAYEIAKHLSRFGRVRLYIVPFHLFGIKVGEIEQRYELVIFKRFLLKLAERLSKEYGYKGIATGDSLSQVASQTLDNINAISYGIDIPVFRPLVSCNKEEIIGKAKRYGTYEMSIKEYKDCCSIVSKHPATTVKPDKVKALEKQMNIDAIVDRSIEDMITEDL